MNTLRTERLLLRRWREEDGEPFAAMNADPRVMEFFPAVRTREESLASMAGIEAHFEKNGFGLYAVEVPDVAPFIGLIGLGIPGFESAFTPCVEIGWRLAAEHWGQGYATEGARACLELGFGELGLEEIVSFTATQNLPSRRVMEKLGMTHDPREDFDHPNLEPDCHVLRHVLYRIRASD